MVCKGFCNHLMELRNTATSSASRLDMGTVSMHSSTVFLRQLKNF